MDFYLRNVKVLSNYKVSLFLVTVCSSVDDSVRKLSIIYGVKLVVNAGHIGHYWGIFSPYFSFPTLVSLLCGLDRAITGKLENLL
jgi:hypothetical protein